MAEKRNLTIDQGSDYETTITVTNDDDTAKNLTGFTGAGQLRKYYTSSTATDLTINIVAAQGIVKISLDKSTSNNMSAGRYVYDVELTDSANTTTRIVEGIATIKPGVTKS